MNKSKRKVMIATNTPIYVNNTQIENVEGYTYLGQRYSTRDKNQDKEIQRRITAGWTAFAKHRDICTRNIGTCLKRQIYSSCVRTSSNGIRRRNMGTHQPSKEQASSRTYKDGKEYHLILGQKNKHLVREMSRV